MNALYEVGGLSAPSTLPASAASVAYFCLTCGEVWARIRVAGASWRVRTTPCEAHAARGAAEMCSVPGSLVDQLVDERFFRLGDEATSLAALPPALRARELEVHLRYFLRSQDD